MYEIEFDQKPRGDGGGRSLFTRHVAEQLTNGWTTPTSPSPAAPAAAEPETGKAGAQLVVFREDFVVAARSTYEAPNSVWHRSTLRPQTQNKLCLFAYMSDVFFAAIVQSPTSPASSSLAQLTDASMLFQRVWPEEMESHGQIRRVSVLSHPIGVRCTRHLSLTRSYGVQEM